MNAFKLHARHDNFLMYSSCGEVGGGGGRLVGCMNEFCCAVAQWMLPGRADLVLHCSAVYPCLVSWTFIKFFCTLLVVFVTTTLLSKLIELINVFKVLPM